MWMVMVLRHWESVVVNVAGMDAPITHSPGDPCIGFLPVFATREAAVEFAEDEALVQEIREIKTAPDADPTP